MDNQRFSRIEFIASGGFARVYRAIDNWSGKTVAVKELINPVPNVLPRFRRERDMLTIHRNNPFVVEILDSNFNGPSPYLVLEYASLGSLQKYVGNRRPWRRVAGWLFDISYGLTLIHERGDLVRDVKPSNLLRFKREDGSDLIKIADFGLGQRADNPFGQMTTSVFGTKGYIDPVAKTTGKFRAASDIYSMGITMRELLTGSRGLWTRIPGPPEFGALIVSMTDADVEKRPTARQVFDQVRAILEAPVTAPIEHSHQKGSGWLLAGAALIVGALLLGAGD